MGIRDNNVIIYDTTLRDGAQAEGISFTVGDKLNIVKTLDEFGISYIEAGNPGSNSKDEEFFIKVRDLKLKHSTIVAFGSTRRANIKVEEDANIKSLIKADTKTVAIFGKSWGMHVTEILHTTLEENLAMIGDSIKYLKSLNKEVIFDSEHFFDGYKEDKAYAISTLKVAEESGADYIVLCDTNGGSIPSEIGEISKEIMYQIKVPLGIHCHNDSGVAVANTLIAIQNGLVMIQGTINGYGERCGNTDLCTIIPNLELKLNKKCLEEGKLMQIASLARYISEIANFSHNERAPYVGNSAFAHKGGMHIDAVLKNPTSFEHISPESVGNRRRLLMSEVSGRSTIMAKINEVEPWLNKDSIETKKIIDKLKDMEHEGYQFEGADGSFKLMIRRVLGKNKKFFDVKEFQVNCAEHWKKENSSYALIKVEVDGNEEITAAEGDGPVNALDGALRKALKVFYPSLNKIRLTDYKVRVLDTSEATRARVRVHIETTDGEKVWSTVGVSTNLIEASWIALIDSIEFFLNQDD